MKIHTIKTKAATPKGIGAAFCVATRQWGHNVLAVRLAPGVGPEPDSGVHIVTEDTWRGDRPAGTRVIGYCRVG